MGTVHVKYGRDGLSVALRSEPDVDPGRWDEAVREVHTRGFVALQEDDEPVKRFPDGSELHVYLHRDLYDLLGGEDDAEAIVAVFNQLRFMITEDA